MSTQSNRTFSTRSLLKQIMIRSRSHLWISLILLGLICLSLAKTSPAFAQQSRQLIITETDASSAPTISLTVIGTDGSGGPINFANTPLTVTHDGVPVPPENVTIIPDAATVGTFTVFIVDVPPGVQDDIPTIQSFMEGYASPTYMEQEVDFATVYRVGTSGANELLPPTEFHNTLINLFITGIAPETGATALYDSVGGLLNNIGALKPDPFLIPVFVLISDGTDSISSEFVASDVPARAAALGIPLHTVWLSNPAVASQDEGRRYMEGLATQTGGLTATLDAPELIDAIWADIAGRGKQSIVRYTVDAITGGDHTVAVNLTSDPDTSAETTISIPPEAPSIILALPAESSTLIVTSLDQPVENIRLASTISWLDGVDREIVAAELIVNGATVMELDPASLNSFDPLISVSNGFIFGDNRIQIWVEDDAGGFARSGEVVLTINQGEEVVIPPEIQQSTFDQYRSWFVWAGGCLLTLFMIMIVFGIMWMLRNSPLFRSLGLTSYLMRIPFIRPYIREIQQIERGIGTAKRYKRQADRVKGKISRYDDGVRGSGDSNQQSSTRPTPYLEVMESTTRLGPRIELEEVELRLGRSPNQSDLAFNDDITMSRLHATIVQEGVDYRIFDEQSTSGTFVNGQRVPDYGIQLIDRDEIRLGGVLLRFRQP